MKTSMQTLTVILMILLAVTGANAKTAKAVCEVQTNNYCVGDLKLNAKLVPGNYVSHPNASANSSVQACLESAGRIMRSCQFLSGSGQVWVRYQVDGVVVLNAVSKQKDGKTTVDAPAAVRARLARLEN